MRLNTMPSCGQSDVYHAVLLQKLSHDIGQVILIIAPFKAITLIDFTLVGDVSHVVSVFRFLPPKFLETNGIRNGNVYKIAYTRWATPFVIWHHSWRESIDDGRRLKIPHQATNRWIDSIGWLLSAFASRSVCSATQSDSSHQLSSPVISCHFCSAPIFSAKNVRTGVK